VGGNLRTIPRLCCWRRWCDGLWAGEEKGCDFMKSGKSEDCGRKDTIYSRWQKPLALRICLRLERKVFLRGGVLEREVFLRRGARHSQLSQGVSIVISRSTGQQKANLKLRLHRE
jgi:hypothetical protein